MVCCDKHLLVCFFFSCCENRNHKLGGFCQSTEMASIFLLLSLLRVGWMGFGTISQYKMLINAIKAVVMIGHIAEAKANKI